jgi:hypothetical protein
MKEFFKTPRFNPHDALLLSCDIRKRALRLETRGRGRRTGQCTGVGAFQVPDRHSDCPPPATSPPLFLGLCAMGRRRAPGPEGRCRRLTPFFRRVLIRLFRVCLYSIFHCVPRRASHLISFPRPLSTGDLNTRALHLYSTVQPPHGSTPTTVRDKEVITTRKSPYTPAYIQHTAQKDSKNIAGQVLHGRLSEEWPPFATIA